MKQKKTPIQKRKGAITLVQIKSAMKDMLTEFKDEIKIEIYDIKGDIKDIKGDIVSIKSDICDIKDEQVRMNDKIFDLYGIMHQDFAKKEDQAKLEIRVEELEVN